MKPHSILACFFAAYGVYLSATSLFSAVISIGGLIMAFQFSEAGGYNAIMFMYAFIPLAVGISLVLFARRLGLLAAKFAGVLDAPAWELGLSARNLLSVLLAVTGVYITITQGAQLVRFAWLFFKAQATTPSLSETAQRPLPDNTTIIALAVAVTAGVLLAKKCRSLSGVFLPDKNA